MLGYTPPPDQRQAPTQEQTPPLREETPPPPAVRMVLECNLVSLEARMVRYWQISIENENEAVKTSGHFSQNPVLFLHRVKALHKHI